MIPAPTAIREVSPRWLQANTPDLIRAHWREVGSHRPLDVLFEHYDELDESGQLRTLVIEHRSEVVGYAILRLGLHRHSGELVAFADAVFVLPDYRRRWGVGAQLVAAVEQAAGDAGAAEIAWSAKPGTRFARQLERRPDYRLEEMVFTKRLP